MGLDMYAYAVPANLVPADQMVDVELTQTMAPTEIAYWRKHHDLHGFMHRLYKEKGGAGPDFNCDTVRLTADDLDRLEAAVKSNSLPPTTGFFFGNFPPDSESAAQDLEFIKRARAEIAAGNAVYYSSWW